MTAKTKNIVVNVVVNRYDPTRSTMLRNSFTRDSNRRFNKLAVAVREAVQKNDIFGLSMQVNEKLDVPNKRAFANLSEKDKVDAFLKWINQKYAETILNASPLFLSNNYVWTDKYALDAYKRGVQLARSELKKIGYSVPEQNLATILSSNSHKNMISAVLADTYNGYTTIAKSMDSYFAQILTYLKLSGCKLGLLVNFNVRHLKDGIKRVVL